MLTVLIVLADKQNGGGKWWKNHILSDMLSAISPGLPAIWNNSTTLTPSTEPTTAESFAKQSKDLLLYHLAPAVGTSGSHHFHNRIGFLFCGASIYGAIQKVFPRSLQPRLLQTYQYPRIHRNPTERSKHVIIWRKLNWPPMTNEVYTAVNNCGERAQNRASEMRTRHLKFLLVSSSRELIAVDFFSPVPKTTNG